MRGIQTKNKTPTICLVLIITAVLLVLPQTVSAASPQWNLQITNLAGTNATLTYDELLALPKTTVYAELYCFGSPVTSGVWGGVKLSDLLNQSGLDQTVGSVVFVAQDGYKASLPIQTALQPDVIIAYEKDSTPLSETLRLVVPHENGAIWIAMVTSISMSPFGISQSQATNSMVSRPDIPRDRINTQQPNQVQPTPTVAPSNTPTSIPTKEPAPTVNATQSPPQQNTSKEPSFPFEIVYAVALAAVITMVVAGFVIHRRKNP